MSKELFLEHLQADIAMFQYLGRLSQSPPEGVSESLIKRMRTAIRRSFLLYKVNGQLMVSGGYFDNTICRDVTQYFMNGDTTFKVLQLKRMTQPIARHCIEQEFAKNLKSSAPFAQGVLAEEVDFRDFIDKLFDPTIQQHAEALLGMMGRQTGKIPEGIQQKVEQFYHTHGIEKRLRGRYNAVLKTRNTKFLGHAAARRQMTKLFFGDSCSSNTPSTIVQFTQLLEREYEQFVERAIHPHSRPVLGTQPDGPSASGGTD